MTNPYLPEPPPDGQHIFEGSYRCKRCAVYNRPDVPSTKMVLDAPCEGRYAQSGTMRAWAEDKWREDLAAQAKKNAPLYNLLRRLDDEESKNMHRLSDQRFKDEGHPSWHHGWTEFTDAELFDTRLAIIKPFLAELWNSAYDAGMQDADPRMPDYTPNPYEDTP